MTSPAHDAIYEFHQDCVRVSDHERKRLRRLRDLNLHRLRASLMDHDFPAPRSVGQGGYAMNTLTQRDDGDQDIDVALIFPSKSLPDGARAARNRLYEVVSSAAPGTFSHPPERRTNAVTVWYADGYHIDFAIYREVGRRLEHAGPQWTPSDPRAVVTWFQHQNKIRSPSWSQHRTVKSGQLRRIVRILKYLRQGDWNDYPGGFLITVLAVRCYQPSPEGDDVSLLATMRAMSNQLQFSTELIDPCLGGGWLTLRTKDHAKLRRYHRLLKKTLRALEPLTCRRPRTDPVAVWEEALGFEW